MPIARSVLDSTERRPAPEGAKLTAQGHPRTIFKRAIERATRCCRSDGSRGGAADAHRGARADGPYRIGRKEPHRLPRVGARWLLLYLEENERATLNDAIFATMNPSGLPSTIGSEAALSARRGLVPRSR